MPRIFGIELWKRRKPKNQITPRAGRVDLLIAKHPTRKITSAVISARRGTRGLVEPRYYTPKHLRILK